MQELAEVCVDDRFGPSRFSHVLSPNGGSVKPDVHQQPAERPQIAVASYLLLREVDLEVALVDEKERRQVAGA
jgi:hypothetical protein